VILFMSGIAWLLLQRAIVHADRGESQLQRAIGEDWKGKLSGLGYAIAVAFAFIEPVVAIVIYVAIAIIWLVPDRRITRQLEHE